ncbi:yggt family protein [Luminiphilus syltensis NOR5-1B]|uniref:Yggt family protein n=1 Tax=Luminiphilus syltensis NOR5-1B TaxID=565045 RepID=B8KU78_9GAMM|nr:YggT family protein [Luminiphilus syltensis]EED34989.1 yggt family protein [Luminiphilus syltensis NOR5-1B]
MGATTEIGIYLIQTVTSLYLILIILRLILHASRADFFNPISQFIARVTNPPLRVLRRGLPSSGRIDLSCVALALLVQSLGIALTLLLIGYMPPNPAIIILWSCVGILGLLVNTYFFALLAMIILSWVAAGSRHPAILLIYQITEPVMAPFRSLLPNFGGLDFSPILLFILINVLQIALRHMAVAVELPARLVIGL